MLFQDPSYLKSLDDFFHLSRMMAESPNPSGTAHTLLTFGQGELLYRNPITGVGTQLAGAALSKLLHSPAGVKLLTQGLRMPLANTAAGTAWLNQLQAITSGSQSHDPGLGQPAFAVR